MSDEFLHPETRNIAAKLDEKELTEIGNRVYEEWRHDEESRKQWIEKHAFWLKMYYQDDKPKNPPWEGSSSESLPLLAEGCTQFAARAYKAMFPSRNFIKAIPVGKDDSHSIERAKRVGAHMAWQCTVKDKLYKRGKDRLLLGVPLHGSVFTKSYYCPARKRNIVDNVRAIDLTVSYGVGPRELEDIERKTHIIRMSVNKTRILKEKGVFIDEGTPAVWDEAKNNIDRAHDQSHGLTEPGMIVYQPVVLLEQHRLLDLDDDGIEEPYVVTVDAATRKVLRIVVRYDTDELGNPTADKEPVEYFTHYPYMENPDGFYGLGLGHLISQPNASVNKLLRQFIDAATLANVGNNSGFMSQQLGGIEGREIQMKLGQFVKVPGSVEDLQKGIWVPKYPGPQVSMLQAIELLAARSDRLATVTEAITGQTDKVVQPTALLALIEQSLQVFSSVYERINEAWSNELSKLYRLNHKFLDPKEYFAVLDVAGELKQFTVAREDYAPDLQILPVADPKMATEQQRLTKANAEWQFLSTNPLVLNSPQHLYNASRRYLEAMQSENIDEILPNPGNTMMMRIDDPGMENLLALQQTPMMPMAFPDQDHQMHLQLHMAELNNPVSALSSLGRSLLMEHVKAHAVMMSGVMNQGMQMNGQANAQGLAPGADDPVGAGRPGPEVPGAGMEDGSYAGQAEQGPGMAGSGGLSQGAAPPA